MATCKDCLHYEPCDDYGNILDPIHGGVICDSFKPTKDVVEVVRCKDCIYSKKYNYLESEERCMCERKFVRHGIYKKPAMLEVSKDDFCSYGEKKGGEHT